MGRFDNKFFILMLLLSVIIVINVNGGFAATLEVGPGHTYSEINSAIDDSAPYDEILVYPNNGYAYVENVVIHQNHLNVRAETTNGKVTISAYDNSLPTVTIDSTGHHSTLQGFIITGADARTDESIGVKVDDNAEYSVIANNNITGNNHGLVLHASNCEINGNIIYVNYEEGINVQSDPSNNIISGNTIESNQGGGIVLDHTVSGCSINENIIKNNLYCGIAVFTSSNYINITGNNIEGNPIGINYFSAGTGNTITSNNITGNGIDGIYLNENTASILFNRLYNNGQYDLHSAATGQVKAENNWWGTNTPGSTKIHGSVDYDPWIILKATATTNHVPHSGTATITGDLTYNSDNIQPTGGYIPNGVLTTFQVVSGADYGGVFPLTNYTTNGTAASVFTGTSTTGTATINITVDGQHVGISILVGESNIVITKTVEDGYTHELKTIFNQGDKPLYRITITNNGPDSATGWVMDLLPNGLTYLMRWVSTNNGTSWTWNSTAYDFVTGNWSIGTLASGASATILAILTNITVSDTTITNNATLYLNEYNGNTNYANITITINPNFLSGPLAAISSSTGAPSVAYSSFILSSNINNEINTGYLQIIITDKNIYFSPLKEILIQILLSAGLESLSHTWAFFDPVNGFWKIENLNPDETLQIIIIALIDWDANVNPLLILNEILMMELV